MKTINLITGMLFSLLLLSSCTKSYYRDGSGTKPPFIVGGVTDFSISDNNSFYYMDIQVDYNSGNQESVKLSLEGLPAGITAEFSQTSGYPPLHSYVLIKDSLATPGTYRIKLIVTGSVSGRKEFPMTMVVEEVPDCSMSLTGTYSASGNCTSSSMHTETITYSPGVKRRINFTNFENLGITVYGVVNCSNTSIDIPSQTVGIHTIEGSGSYFYDPSTSTTRMYVSYQRTTTGMGTNNCSIYMNK